MGRVDLASELLDLPPWQRRMAAAILDGQTISYSRRNGRTAMQLFMIKWHVWRGESVHHLAADGEWCVTSQPVGLLWARVRRT